MNFKIVTAVATEPVSLAEARLQVRLTADDSSAEDSLLTAWITAAREIAERYTGLALAPQTLEAALDEFPCHEEIALPRPPVASITSVKYTDLAGVEQTVDAGDYTLSPYGDANRLAPAYGKFWPTSQDIMDSVRIRYVTGYGAVVGEATPHPHEKTVKAAILLMVAWMYENRGDEMSVDDIQPPAAKSLLNSLKRWER